MVVKGFILSLLIFPLMVFSAVKEELLQLQVVTEILPPYQYIKPDNAMGGLATDKLNALFSALQATPDIQAMPWARAYKIAQTQPNTLIYSIVRTPERESLFQWIGVLVSTKTFLVGLQARGDIEINNLRDLNNYRIGVKRDDVVYQYLNKHLLPGKMVFLPETETTLKMLIKQRVDIIAASPLHLDFMCKRLGCQPADFRYLYELTGLNSDFYLAASNNTPADIVQLLKQTLRQLE
ncbi:transporter substrate-binding domain-containing protein [Thalassomonas viridans]|uniref:Transporter substrate-binding domain-containing protein n=1 Tax=Thalassomonas viridans TaxID=137584 RepID=A0AAE9Z6S2_9GAMM|nr:transporter substrate-binding domain-containing protein [Thalassomonas viridans]WDE07653.1 transporter substrate-binding domain-containing protein [Thalassomonas viridans]